MKPLTNGQFAWLEEFYYGCKCSTGKCALVKKLYNADIKELELQKMIIVYKNPGCYSVEITEIGKAEVVKWMEPQLS